MLAERRRWDSNPGYGCPHTRIPGVLLRPLGHVSRCRSRSTPTAPTVTGRTRKTPARHAEARRAESATERQGFEPWVPVRVHRFSKPTRSTAPASLLSDADGRKADPGHQRARSSFHAVRIRRPLNASLANGQARPFPFARALRKKLRRMSPHSSASSPPSGTTRWLRRGSFTTSRTEPHAPAFGSKAP